jgi:hypothetical protein
MSAAPRPSFTRDFPRDSALDALVEAFARGDFAAVRAGAPALAKSADERVRAAAQLLVERTRPDPLAVGLLVATAVLLVVMAAYWISHGRPPPAAAPTAPAVEHVH